jgi:predicted SAM-dependent methyltransferase
MFAYKEIGAPMNTNLVLLRTKGQQVADARNYFVDQALKLKAKYLFFMDEDVAPPPYSLRELMFQLEHHPDWGVIGGIYALKCERPEPLVFRGRGTGPFWKWRVGEVFECTGIGMGCTLIRTDVFRDLGDPPWFQTVQDLDAQLDNIQKGTVWTEDLWFCNELTTKTKWKIIAHGQIICPHYDMVTGAAYELPPESYPMRHLMLSHGKKKIADLGCGENKYKTKEGQVVGVDIRDLPGVDYRCDLHKLPFATGSFDIVYSSHTLEHFPRTEAKEVLAEWVRILHPKGELRLILPNLAWAAKNVLAGKVDCDTLNVFYGSQEYGENFHMNGFTPATIAEILKKLGFKHQSITEQGLSIVVQAMRSKPKALKALKTKKGKPRTA